MKSGSLFQVQRRARCTPFWDGDSDPRRPRWTFALRFLHAFPLFFGFPVLLFMTYFSLPRGWLLWYVLDVWLFPLSLRHRLLLLRYDGQYKHQVSPVDSGGRQSSIARTPSPRVSLRRICFRACVCRFLLIMLLRERCVPWPSGGIPGGVAGVVSSELTKGYRSDSGIGCNFRDMVFAVRAWSNVRSG